MTEEKKQRKPSRWIVLIYRDGGWHEVTPPGQMAKSAKEAIAARISEGDTMLAISERYWRPLTTEAQAAPPPLLKPAMLAKTQGPGIE